MPFPAKQQHSSGPFSGLSTDKSARMIYDAGKTAYRAGTPIWANPHVGAPAGLWSDGWRGVRYQPGDAHTRFHHGGRKIWQRKTARDRKGTWG